MAKKQKTEVWKDVIGFEGLYQVSNWGRAKSMPRMVSWRGRIPGVILKKRFIKSGSKLIYNSLCLWKDGVASYHLLHRLIAKAFIPNPENKPQVNHKDLDTLNNNSANLEWTTCLENHRHGRVSRTNGVEAKHVKLTRAAVLDIRTRTEPYQAYMEKYGVAQSTISCVQRGTTWAHV